MLSPLVSGFWRAIVGSCSQIKNELENNLPQPLLRWFFFFLSLWDGLSNKFNLCLMRSPCNRSHTKPSELLLSQPYFQTWTTRMNHKGYAHLPFVRVILWQVSLSDRHISVSVRPRLILCFQGRGILRESLFRPFELAVLAQVCVSDVLWLHRCSYRLTY